VVAGERGGEPGGEVGNRVGNAVRFSGFFWLENIKEALQRNSMLRFSSVFLLGNVKLYSGTVGDRGDRKHLYTAGELRSIEGDASV